MMEILYISKIELNKEVMSEIEMKCGLPLVPNNELGKAAAKYAKRI